MQDHSEQLREAQRRVFTITMYHSISSADFFDAGKSVLYGHECYAINHGSSSSDRLVKSKLVKLQSNVAVTVPPGSRSKLLRQQVYNNCSRRTIDPDMFSEHTLWSARFSTPQETLD